MTQDQVFAAARHVVSVAAGMGVVLGLMKVGDTEKLMQGLQDITQGIGEIMVVLGPLIGGLMAWYAARASGLTKSISRVADMPDTTVVTSSHVANASPHANVVSTSTHTVVPNDQIVSIT